jgi:hypothetical protein
VPCTIVSNNIESPELREVVSRAIREGIGEKPGEWKVIVYQAADYAGLGVRISGPEDLRCNWTFFGNEQSPDFIRERVAQSIAAKQILQSQQDDSSEPEVSSELEDPLEPSE